MSEQTERDKLIQYWAGTESEPTELHPDIAESIADFVIADRRRVAVPLVKHKENIIKVFGKREWGKTEGDVAIQESLTLAGIETT